MTVDPDRAQPGITIVEYNPSDRPDDDPGGQMILGFDDEGEVVFWYRSVGSIGAVEPTDRGTFISHQFPVGIREFDVIGRVVGNWQVDRSRRPSTRACSDGPTGSARATPSAPATRAIPPPRS